MITRDTRVIKLLGFLELPRLLGYYEGYHDDRRGRSFEYTRPN